MAQVRSLKTGIKFKDTPIGKVPMDWEVKPFIEVMVLQRGFDLPVQNRTEGLYPILASNGIIDCHNEFKVKGPGVITGRSGSLGKVHYIEADYWPLNTTLYVKNYFSNDPKFLYYFLQVLKIEKFGTGTGVPTLNRNIVHEINVALPPLPEQKKIAEILSNVDDAIEETDKIIEKTKELKKGLMQKLLTKGIGHKKFKKTKIGRIPKEWKVVRLMDISKINPEQIGNSYPKKCQIKYLDISGITQTGCVKEIKDVTFEEAPSRARRVAQKNDILVSTVRPYLRAFARLKTCPDNFIVSTGYAVIRPENPEDSEYIYQNILNEQFIKFLLPHMTGTNYPAVRPNDIENYLIAFPTENERKKIANILSLVDSEIENEENNKQGLEALKKSLMQVLLTGKVRVKIP